MIFTYIIAVMVLLQYIPRNMHTVFALLCFVVVIHWLIFPYPSGLLHWHCGNLTIAPVPAKQPWWIWINTSCEFIMNDYITPTKQSTTKTVCIFLGIYCRLHDIVRMISHGVKTPFSQNTISPNGCVRVWLPCWSWQLTTFRGYPTKSALSAMRKQCG